MEGLPGEAPLVRLGANTHRKEPGGSFRLEVVVHRWW